MTDVAEPELAGHQGLGPAEFPGQRMSHLAYRVRLAAGDVVGAQLTGLAGGQRRDVRRRHVADMHEIPPLRAVLEDPRRPARLQRGTEDRRDTRVRSVLRHSGAVDIVIPQRQRSAAGQPRPDTSKLLLGHLADRIRIARVKRRGLGDCRRAQAGRAVRAPGLESAQLKVTSRARRGLHPAMCPALVAALAVYHHGRSQHQPGYLALAHRGEQYSRARDVDVAVARQVCQVRAEADQGGLVADHVDAREGRADRGLIADIADDELDPGRPVGRLPVVHRRRERVHGTDLMPGRQGSFHNVRADEAGRAGDKDAHAGSQARSAPAGQRSAGYVTAP